MKKATTKAVIYKALYAISTILFLCFVIFSIVDCVNYNSSCNSAPLYVYFLVRGVEFLLPCLMALIIAIIIRRKTSSRS